MGIWEFDFDSNSGRTTSPPRAQPTPTDFAGRLDVYRLDSSMVFVNGYGKTIMNRTKIDLNTFQVTGISEIIVEEGLI